MKLGACLMQIGPKGTTLYHNELHNELHSLSQEPQAFTIYPVNGLKCPASLPPVLTLPRGI